MKTFIKLILKKSQLTTVGNNKWDLSLKNQNLISA